MILSGGTGATLAAWTFAGEGKDVAIVDRKVYRRLVFEYRLGLMSVRLQPILPIGCFRTSACSVMSE